MWKFLSDLWKSFESFFFHQWIAFVILLISVVFAYEMNMRGIHFILILTDAIVLICLFHVSSLREQPLLIRAFGTAILGFLFSWIMYFLFWNYSPIGDAT